MPAQFQAIPVRENDSLALVLRVAETFVKELQEQRRAIEDIRRQMQLLSPEKLQARQDDCNTRTDRLDAKVVYGR